MSPRLTWKIGFEVELLAPPGLSRADLARATARRCGGAVRPFFHPQSEPSQVPGQPLFENLTPGFEVTDATGRRIAAFVDDLTLQADLDKGRPPLSGWYRIVADDGRLLRLVVGHCDATASGDTVLDPLAALFGTATTRNEAGMVRVVDDRGVSVAICAPLPGERERPCEMVTAPLERGHRRVLEGLLADARKLQFTLPVEGATHIHFDAGTLCSARTVGRLVSVLDRHGEALRRVLGVNERCVRLGPWPADLLTLVHSDAFITMDWPKARLALTELKLTKYCDFNLCNLIAENPAKHTFEVRILPTTLEADAIILAAALFEGILKWSREGSDQTPDTLFTLLLQLPLSGPVLAWWLSRVRGY